MTFWSSSEIPSLLSSVFSVTSVVKGFRRSRATHDPAAFILALVFEIEHARSFEFGKRRIPEMQMQNLALLRQKVVLDIQPVHCLQMSPQNGSRNRFCQRRSFISALLDFVQRPQPDFFVLRILRVPLGSPRVQIPTVVIEARLARQAFDIRNGFFLEMLKSHNHIGNLNSGIVDVVLHIDFPPSILQQAHKRVAQNGIAQMPDVRSFVGIDAGVLDQESSRKAPPSSALRFSRLTAPGPRDSHARLCIPRPLLQNYQSPQSRQFPRQFPRQFCAELCEVFSPVRKPTARHILRIAHSEAARSQFVPAQCCKFGAKNPEHAAPDGVPGSDTRVPLSG